MRRLMLVSALTILMPLSAGPSLAQEDKTPETLALEGLDRMMRALELFVDTIPLYEPPEVLPNGDIIIRRIPRGDESAPQRGDKEEGGVKDI